MRRLTRSTKNNKKLVLSEAKKRKEKTNKSTPKDTPEISHGIKRDPEFPPRHTCELST